MQCVFLINTPLCRHYIGLMKSKQPQGPYWLIGYSYGATIAFEMSLQLQAAGEKVDHLVLLDGSVYYMQAYRKMCVR